jgi:hypothetical protein
MRHYVLHDGTWTEAASDAVDPPHVEITEDPPTLHFVGETNASFQLPGAPARSDTETVHTVAIVDPSLTDGITLCALRAERDDLTVEDRRPDHARTRYGDAFEQLQSALDEILIPVYIDDAIEEVSESVEGLVALHTAQYADPPAASCGYFRTSVFRDGTLLLEAEYGSL